MKKKSVFIVLLAVFTLSLLVLASIQVFAAGGDEEKEKRYTVYQFEVGLWHPFFWAHIHGSQDAAAKYPNLDLVILDGRNDPAFQASQITQAIAKGVDGIILNPVTSDALIPAAKAATEAGIPVFTTDRDIGDPQWRLGSVKGHHYELGRLAADYAVNFMENSGIPKPWNVVLLQGLAGHVAAGEQVKGWFEILNPYIDRGDIKIVADVPAEWSKEVGLTKMQQILVKTKDIDLVICGNDAVAAGAIIAIEAAGLTPGKDIYLTGVDVDPDGIQLVKEGKIICTVVHEARLLGYWAVDMMMKYLEEEKLPPKDKYPDGTIRVIHYIADKTNIDNIEAFGDFKVPKPGEPMPETPPLPY
jgi:ABC-type sugar transport system substrate-binding protein